MQTFNPKRIYNYFDVNILNDERRRKRKRIHRKISKKQIENERKREKQKFEQQNIRKISSVFFFFSLQFDMVPR